MSKDYDGSYSYFEDLAKESMEKGDYKSAEKYLMILLAKCESNSQEDKSWQLQLPICYINIGNLALASKNTVKAEELFLKALELTNQLIQENPALRREAGLVNIFYKLMNLYTHLERNDEAASYYSKILQELDEMIQSNIYDSNLSQAESICIRKSELINECFKTFPSRTPTDLLDTVRTLQIIYSLQMNVEKGINLCNEFIPLCQAMASLEPEKYTPYMAGLYMNAFTYTLNEDYLNKALNYAKQHPEDDKSKEVIELANGLSSFQ